MNDLKDLSNEDGAATAPKSNPFPDWLKWSGGGLLALIMMIVVSLATQHFVRPAMVAFDMKGTIDLFIQQSAQLKLSETDAKAKTMLFNRALEDSLADWQNHHNAVIVVAPAVVSKVPDITAEIQDSIHQRMLAQAR